MTTDADLQMAKEFLQRHRGEPGADDAVLIVHSYEVIAKANLSHKNNLSLLTRDLAAVAQAMLNIRRGCASEKSSINRVSHTHNRALLGRGEVVDIEFDEYRDEEGNFLPSSWDGDPMFWGLDGSFSNTGIFDGNCIVLSWLSDTEESD